MTHTQGKNYRDYSNGYNNNNKSKTPRQVLHTGMLRGEENRGYYGSYTQDAQGDEYYETRNNTSPRQRGVYENKHFAPPLGNGYYNSRVHNNPKRHTRLEDVENVEDVEDAEEDEYDRYQRGAYQSYNNNSNSSNSSNFKRQQQVVVEEVYIPVVVKEHPVRRFLTILIFVLTGVAIGAVLLLNYLASLRVGQ